MTSASDGLVPWDGRAEQVRVGHLVQGSKGTKNDVWEILEMKNPAQIEYGCGMWWKAVNRASGEVVAIPPKLVRDKITFMVTPDEFDVCEVTRRPPALDVAWPVDSDEVALLVEKLGAQHIAIRDNVTGEIHCPDYAAGASTNGWHTRRIEQLEHLRIAHGIDTAGIEGLEGPAREQAIVDAHGRQHGPKNHRYLTKGGFPHRHVPEDHSIL